MLPDIKTVKERRIKQSISQKDLAKMSSVSQSMIAKIESGNIMPSYSVMKRILRALDFASEKDEKKCRDVMSKKILSVNKTDRVAKVSKLMHRHSISQIPVTSNGNIIGVVSESIFLEKLSEGVSSDTLMNELVESVMGSPLTLVDLYTPVKFVIPIVREYGAVLVTNRGVLCGIITRSDLF